MNFQHVLLKKKNPRNHFALFLSLHPSHEPSQTFPILMPLVRAATGGRKSSRLNDYCVNCFHLGGIMARILVISTIIYKSALWHCSTAPRKACTESFPIRRHLICLLRPYITHEAASVTLFNPMIRRKAALLITLCSETRRKSDGTLEH